MHLLKKLNKKSCIDFFQSLFSKVSNTNIIRISNVLAFFDKIFDLITSKNDKPNLFSPIDFNNVLKENPEYTDLIFSSFFQS